MWPYPKRKEGATATTCVPSGMLVWLINSTCRGCFPSRTAAPHSRDIMLLTRIRPAGAFLFAAACFLLPGVGRPDEKDKSPEPKLTHEQIRKDLEASLAGLSPGETLAFLNQLAQEWTARKGGYEVAHPRFTARARELSNARQRLADLKGPDAKPPLILRAADVDAAIKAAQQHAEYATARVQHIEAIKTAIAATTERHRLSSTASRRGRRGSPLQDEDCGYSGEGRAERQTPARARRERDDRRQR